MHGDPGERVPQGSVRLSATLAEPRHGQQTRPNRHPLLERICHSIAAGDYLTSEKIDMTVDCIYRELFGR